MVAKRITSVKLPGLAHHRMLTEILTCASISIDSLLSNCVGLSKGQICKGVSASLRYSRSDQL